jgi:integrase
MTYVVYCYREQHMELTTICSRTEILLRFFTWVRRQEKLTGYPYWTKESAQAIFRAFASTGCSGVKVSSRRQRLAKLAHFFATLAELEYPVPAGYRLLHTLAKREEWQPRLVPSEEVLDHVFRHGVCALSYDPFARLALTIQYYCGTRVTETSDLHLFCVLEDRNGHVYLLIPKGKTREERPFPIIELGMGPLLEYMDEIVARRLSPDGISRTLGKTNLRYLDNDPERAKDWQYLFDRVPGGVVKRRGRLSAGRIRGALHEALLLAAKVHSDGLFQEETYSSVCRHQRQRGQYCFYFATQEGITICPCCGSPLSGQRGVWCRHILREDFKCDGIAPNGEIFCPKCDRPLAEFLPISPHVFRHNSVSRAHRAGVPAAQNMQLHGHKTLPMHLRYLHLLLEDTSNEVRQIFVEKRLREVRRALGSAPGQVVEGGVAYTLSLEQYLGLTLQRTLKRRTYGIWGGFWAGALAQRGVASPLSVEDEVVIPEDTYEHAVAQYWYEALGLAVSEVAFEHVTNKKWQAEVPPFLDRQKIEALVHIHLHHIQDSLGSVLGLRLMETDILEQRRFLDELAEKLRPWWQHLGAIGQLVEMFAPGGGHAFQKQLPPTEPES